MRTLSLRREKWDNDPPTVLTTNLILALLSVAA